MAAVGLVPVAAHAEEIRVHVTGGAAHAVGGSQQREFGAGGGGSAAVELPLAKAVGLQAGAGAVALSKGEAPADPGLAPTGTGTAVVGTLGFRFRPLAASSVAGPWMSLGGGMARTGDMMRPAADAQLGWAFRASKDARLDVGPFLGYTHVVQPNDALRGDDARIAMAGIAISFGASEKPRAAAPAPVEAPPPSAPLADRDGDLEVVDACPDGEAATDANGCNVGAVVLLADRIQLDDLIHFEFGSARVRSQSHRLVKKVAELISAHPEIVEVSIEGHADAIGTDEFNRQLSVERAATTRRLLVQFGADPARINVVGHGKSRLRFASQRADERNRRVEFWVKRETASAKNAQRAGTRGRP